MYFCCVAHVLVLKFIKSFMDFYIGFRECSQMRMRSSIHADVQTYANAFVKVHKDSYQSMSIRNKMFAFVQVISP